MRWITMKEAHPVPQDCDKYNTNRIYQISHRCFVIAINPEVGNLADTEDRQMVGYDIVRAEAKYTFKREDEVTQFLVKKENREVFTEELGVVFDQLFAERDDMKNWVFSHFESPKYDGTYDYYPKDVIAYYEVPMPDVQLVMPLVDVWATDKAAERNDQRSEHDIVVRTPDAQVSRGVIVLELMHDFGDDAEEECV